MSDYPELLICLADLPGLDPTGLRIALRGWEWYGRPLTLSGVYQLTPPTVAVYLVPGDHPAARRGDGTAEVSVSDIFLDLSNATTRDRCLRWLATLHGRPVGCAAPSWVASSIWLSHWCLDTSAPDGYVVFGGWPRAGVEAVQVPAFLDIDPDDPTALPDGSPLAAALALGAALRAAKGTE